VTPAAMLRRELERDGARPLLTWYDDGSGARVELSVATVANWVAKLANLLVDEHDVEPGVDVGVRLPAHWQTAVLLLGIWTAGGCAVVGGVGDVTVGLLSDDVATVHVAPDTMGVGLSRLAGAQPDDYVGVVPVDGSAPALRLAGRSWSHDELGAGAAHAAHVHGLDATSRVLSALGYDTVDGLDAGLLAPLAAGGSVVLVTHPDPARLEERRTAERVTHAFLD
jgi:uncharacterized protein (TIGR03089 family)